MSCASRFPSAVAVAVIPPILLLSFVLAVTLVAFVADAAARRARERRLVDLASTWQRRFTSDDRFHLAPRVAAHFPIPGAADVVVRDLIYGQESGGQLRYLFTVEYTTGVIRTKRRRVGVAMVVDAPTPARASTQPASADARSFAQVLLAPEQLPLIAQYEWLRQQHEGDDGRQTPAG